MPRGGPRSNTPTQLKVITGTARKDRIHGDEPKPSAAVDLTAPSWLDAMGKRYWRETSAVLDRMGLLTEADLNQLALYCQAWSRYRSAFATIAKFERDGRPEDVTFKDFVAMVSGATVRLEKAEASIRLLSHDLGLNPAARSRLSVGKVDKPVDEMEGLLSGIKRSI